MTERSDDQLLEAFRRRLAGVEADVRDLPPGEPPGSDGRRTASRPRSARLLAVVAVVALVPVVLVGAFVVGAPRPAGIGAAASPTASPAPWPTASSSPAPSNPPMIRLADVANAEQAALEKLMAEGGGPCLRRSFATRMAPDLVAADAEIGDDARPRSVQDGRLWYGDLESALAAFEATFAVRDDHALWIITGEGPTAIAWQIGTYVTPNGHEVRGHGNSAAPVVCPSPLP